VSARPRFGRGEAWLLAAAFLGAALVIYGPALRGAFVSDDFHYVANNTWLHELSLENALAILDPLGAPAINVVNYSPVQLFVHAAAWEVFGRDTLGHHVVNVALHALASLLLVLLFARHGIPRAAAALGGALFLVHPANVEAVAWISQLKSSSALVLSLCALLAWPGRPLAGTLLFALALLAKATAAFVLPVALVLEWAETGRVRWRLAAAAAAALAAFAAVEFFAHQRSGAAEATLHATPLVLARTIAALGLRYLVMAATSWNVSAFHEPEPARSALDPWWLASLPVYALLAGRLAVLLRRVAPRSEPTRGFASREASAGGPPQGKAAERPRSEPTRGFASREASEGGPPQGRAAQRAEGERSRRRAGVELAFWTWALVSFAPVSQVFPFLYPMADRYLYFILPGLVGAALLSGAEAAARWRVPPRVALAVGAAACLALAVRAHERAAIWRSGATLLADAEKHYPDGRVASLLRAKRAAFAGDADGALAELERAVARGYNRFEQLETDSAWDAIRDDPRFRALVRELAARWIASVRRKASPTQTELRAVAHAHVARDEYAEALRVYEAAVDAGGPDADAIRAEVEAVRTALASGDPRVRVRLGATGPE
jgi:hypothetical protein